MNSPEIHLVSPSSHPPSLELAAGVRVIEAMGFTCHQPPKAKPTLFFSNPHELRAKQFYEAAQDSKTQVLWCTRGGYGVNHLLPILDQLTKEQGVPPIKKLLIGYSDATPLMEFVRYRWRWQTLHGPMPALRTFPFLPKRDLELLKSWILKSPAIPHWKNLKLICGKPQGTIAGTLVGGNLSMWHSLFASGSPVYGRGQILFFEDVGETLAKIDRMVGDLSQGLAFAEAKAILLGDFLECNDKVSNCLAKPLQSKTQKPKLKPSRKALSPNAGLREIFSQVSKKWDLPVFSGVPAGHGPNFTPLPLGAIYSLSAKGVLSLQKWGWLDGDET